MSPHNKGCKLMRNTLNTKTRSFIKKTIRTNKTRSLSKTTYLLINFNL